jgi:hypothetical protein
MRVSLNPVKVVPHRITPNMAAPLIVSSTHPVGDLTSGRCTERLFDEAVAAGALVGSGLRLQCVGNDEGGLGDRGLRGSTFVLIAQIGNGESARGATAGRQPTWRVGVVEDEEDPDGREEHVLKALEYFASELNYAIDGWRLANRIIHAREAFLDLFVPRP